MLFFGASFQITEGMVYGRGYRISLPSQISYAQTFDSGESRADYFLDQAVFLSVFRKNVGEETCFASYVNNYLYEQEKIYHQKITSQAVQLDGVDGLECSIAV